nr:hypothetical protein [Moorena sp. SIO2C4]
MATILSAVAHRMIPSKVELGMIFSMVEGVMTVLKGRRIQMFSTVERVMIL